MRNPSRSTRRALWAVLIAGCFIALLFTIEPGCKGAGDEKGGTLVKKKIESVLDAHAGELMSIPGVVGVAVGATEDGQPCIKVLVVSLTPEIRSRVPSELEGYPVVLVESGEIRALDGD